jgi:hypothetical protein
MTNVTDMIEWKAKRDQKFRDDWWKDYSAWRDWMKAEHELCRLSLELAKAEPKLRLVLPTESA